MSLRIQFSRSDSEIPLSIIRPPQIPYICQLKPDNGEFQLYYEKYNKTYHFGLGVSVGGGTHK